MRPPRRLRRWCFAGLLALGAAAADLSAREPLLRFGPARFARSAPPRCVPREAAPAAPSGESRIQGNARVPAEVATVDPAAPPERIARRRSAEAKLLAALAKPLPGDFPATSLADLAQRLTREFGAPVVLHHAGLGRLAVKADAPLEPIQGRGLAWQDALRFSLIPRGLDAHLVDGTLRIGAASDTEGMEAEFFDVGDLAGPPPRETGLEPLTEQVQRCIGRSGDWYAWGDSAKVELFRSGSAATLVVQHRFQERQAVACLLNLLRSTTAGVVSTPSHPAARLRQAAEERIEAALAAPLNEAWPALSPEAFVQKIGARIGAPARLDRDDHREQRFDPQAKIVVQGGGEPLADAVRAALAPWNLHLAPCGGGLVVTASNPLEDLGAYRVQVYDLAGLFDDPPSDAARTRLEDFATAVLHLNRAPRAEGDWRDPSDRFIHRSAGRTLLVARDTADGHRELRTLLADFRASRLHPRPGPPAPLAAEKPPTMESTPPKIERHPSSMALLARRLEIEAKALAALAEPLEEDLPAMSLADLARLLERRTGAPTTLDRESLAADDLTPASFAAPLQGRGSAWQDAVDRCLPRGWSFRLRDGALHLGEFGTDYQGDAGVLDLGELLPQEGLGDDVFIELVYSILGSRSDWEDQGGEASAEVLRLGNRRVLVLRHDFRVRQDAAALIADLHAHQHERPVADLPKAVAVRRAVEARIESGLAAAVEQDWPETTLEALAAELGRRLKAPVFLDVAALDDEGVRPDAKVVVRGPSSTLFDALQRALQPHAARVVCARGAVHLTTRDQEYEAEFLTTRIYDVSDLVVRFTPEGDEYLAVDPLVEAVLDSTDLRAAWDDQGGVAAVRTWWQGRRMLMFVMQSAAAHHQIAGFLGELRARRHTGFGPRAAPSKPAPKAIPGPSKEPSSETNPSKTAPDPEEDPTAEEAAERRAIRRAAADAVNACSWKLFAAGTLADPKKPPENLVFGAWTAASALLPLRGEASTPDRVEERGITTLADLLPWKGERGDLSRGVRSLHLSLPAGGRPDGCEIVSAARLWIRPGGRDDQAERIFAPWRHERRPLETAPLDFSQPAAAAALANAWIDERTKGRIRELVRPADIRFDQQLLWTGADAFDAPWTKPFDRQGTKIEPFHAFGRSFTAPMMRTEADFVYGGGEGLRTLRLPYGRLAFPEGGPDHALEMVVLLPDDRREAVRALVERLSREGLDPLLADGRSRKVKVRLPKFTLRTRAELKDWVAGAGVVKLDWPLPGPLLVLRQETMLEVDEEGTKAASAVALGGGGGGFGPPPPPPVEFYADHPFVFVVRDARTRLILYIGQLVDPRKRS